MITSSVHSVILAGLGMALCAPIAVSAQHLATGGATARGADSDLLIEALEGQAITLTNRGASVSVIASAGPVEQGCAAQLSARSPAGGRRWNRLLRWSDVAWTGVGADGRVAVAFHDHEGRLANDVLAFSATEAPALVAAVKRVAAACRAQWSEGARILASGIDGATACYFPRLPGLQAFPSTTPAHAPRALLRIVARDNPEAELELLLERVEPAAGGGDDWGRPAVAFTFADPGLAQMGVVEAAFALDAKPVTTRHALTAYGDTRLRIRMDMARGPSGSPAADSFYRRLAGSSEVALTLLDGKRQRRAVVHFDAGPALAAARAALTAADWSCAGAEPAPAPASRWQPEP